VREENEKMVVEGEEGIPTPKEQDEPIVEKQTEEPLKTRTNGVENEKEKTTVKKPAEIIKPRDVHFAMKDGRVLVFSPSPPAVPPFDVPTETASAPLGSNSDVSEQLRWDVARVGTDGTREVLYRGLGADEVHLEEGGVKFRVAPSPLTEANDAGDVGGATIPLNEATKVSWRACRRCAVAICVMNRDARIAGRLVVLCCFSFLAFCVVCSSLALDYVHHSSTTRPHLSTFLTHEDRRFQIKPIVDHDRCLGKIR
jgi:hypothetical protein